MKLFQLHRALSPRAKFLIGAMSFVLPIALWCVVSYVPSVWHPQVLITDAGSADYLQIDMHMDRQAFESEVADAKAEHRAPPQGIRSNPIYLPSPGEVATAFYQSFTTPPPTQDGQWLHQSLWHSIKKIGRAHV